MKRNINESESASGSVSLRPYGLYSTWNSPGQNTRVGSLSLLQRTIPPQGSNPGLPHCGQILYLLSHKGSPRMLEWVACPFSTESSQPRNQTRIACNAGRFFPNWATNSSLNKQTKKLELKQQERKERREKGRGEGRKERDHQSICFSNFPSFVPTLCSY